jgi:hypothetical protein
MEAAKGDCSGRRYPFNCRLNGDGAGSSDVARRNRECSEPGVGRESARWYNEKREACRRLHVFMPKEASLTDLKYGSLIGTTAIEQLDGHQEAIQIYIFPDERRHEANLLANSSVVGRENEILRYTERSVLDTKDHVLTIKYTGGEKKITMPANVRIVLLSPATVADIKAGQYFLVPNGKPVSPGTLASTIIIGSNSVDFAM